MRYLTILLLIKHEFYFIDLTKCPESGNIGFVLLLEKVNKDPTFVFFPNLPLSSQSWLIIITLKFERWYDFMNHINLWRGRKINKQMLHSKLSLCPSCAVVKNLPNNAEDTGLIPGMGRWLGIGNGNPLQCSCLENSMYRGTWWGTAQRLQRVGHSWAQKTRIQPLF